jgi:hypothetical protein
VLFAAKSLKSDRLARGSDLARFVRFRQRNAMLRVTVHEYGTLCRLELAGRLGGPWVAETEHAWRSSSCPDKQIEIDMRQVTGVDDRGRELLSAMHQAGAHLVAEGVAMTALIQEITGEITGKQPSTAPRGNRGEKSLSADQRSRIRRNSK